MKENHRLLNEIENLHRDNVQLQTAHVKAVNVVSPGVEHISDQTIVARMVEIQDRVSEFCRATMKGKKMREKNIKTKEASDFIEELLARDRLDLGAGKFHISPENNMEMLFWAVMEDYWARRWLPGIADDKNTALLGLEALMMENGKQSNYAFLIRQV